MKIVLSSFSQVDICWIAYLTEDDNSKRIAFRRSSYVSYLGSKVCDGMGSRKLLTLSSGKKETQLPVCFTCIGYPFAAFPELCYSDRFYCFVASLETFQTQEKRSRKQISVNTDPFTWATWTRVRPENTWKCTSRAQACHPVTASMGTFTWFQKVSGEIWTHKHCYNGPSSLYIHVYMYIDDWQFIFRGHLQMKRAENPPPSAQDSLWWSSWLL